MVEDEGEWGRILARMRMVEDGCGYGRMGEDG